jgi:hypothetical protein
MRKITIAYRTDETAAMTSRPTRLVGKFPGQCADVGVDDPTARSERARDAPAWADPDLPQRNRRILYETLDAATWRTLAPGAPHVAPPTRPVARATRAPPAFHEDEDRLSNRELRVDEAMPSMPS